MLLAHIPQRSFASCACGSKNPALPAKVEHHTHLGTLKQLGEEAFANSATTVVTPQFATTGFSLTRQVSVNDGAIWIWLIVQMCWAPCLEILDWWHLVEKLWEVAAVWFSQDQATTWVESQKDNLWQQGGRPVIHAIRQLCPRGQPLPEKVRQVVSYIFTHRGRIHYQQFRQDGYPIGSGTVESGGKVVVQERMKQAGMRWSRNNAQAMLALRRILLSDRWDEVWSTLAPSSKLA